MQQLIIDQLTSIVEKLIKESDIDDLDYQIKLQENKDKEHGDYASNIAMVIAKSFGSNPKDLAEKISKTFKLDDQVLKVEVAGPGFINFFVSELMHSEILKTIDSEKEKYGHNKSKLGKVLIEYVSSNPTGPLHVGHGRGAVFGSVLAKLLTAAGHEVDEEYYVNDYGRQMNILALSVFLRRLEWGGIDERTYIYPSLCYQGDYIKLIAKDLPSYREMREGYNDNNRPSGYSFDSIISPNRPFLGMGKRGNTEEGIDLMISKAQRILNEEIFRDPSKYQGDEVFSELRTYALNQILNMIKTDLIKLGVNHNLWFFESSLYSEEKGEDSKVNIAISELTSNNFVYEEEGALWFKSSEFKDDKDRVLQRSNGEYTYFSSDVAYHLDKYNRSYDRIINIWGSDHHGYLPRVKAAMEASGKDTNKLEVIFIQFANLVRDGKKISMSTRSGEFITLSELIDEVTADAARFFYINRKADQHLEFDLELAKKQSKDNPLYYIQYAHARICSVFNKVEYDLEEGHKNVSLSLLNAEKEIEIQKHLASFPTLIEKSAESNEPHLICYYLKDLASLFHSYYNSEKFIVDDVNLMNSRMFLLKGIKQVIFNGCEILGVNSPEEM